MIVGICKIALHLPACRSLKEKRMVLRRIKDRSFSSFKIPIAEVGGQDLWQRAEVGFAIVGNDKRVIEGLMQRMKNFIESVDQIQVIDDYSEFVNL